MNKEILFIMLCSILLLSACGGPKQVVVSDTDSEQNDLQTQSTSETTPTQSEQVESESSANAEITTWEEYSDAFLRDGKFHVVYDISMPNGDAELEMWVRDAKSKSQLSGITEGTGYVDMDTGVAYVCSAGSCFKSELEISTEKERSTMVQDISLGGALQVDAKVTTDVYPSGTRSILGNKAQCFNFIPRGLIATAADQVSTTSWDGDTVTVTSNAGTKNYQLASNEGASENCFTAEGYLVYSRTKSASDEITVVEATALDSDVSSSDVSVPQSVIDSATSIPAGITSGAGISTGDLDASVCDQVPAEYKEQCLAGIQ